MRMRICGPPEMINEINEKGKRTQEYNILLTIQGTYISKVLPANSQPELSPKRAGKTGWKENFSLTGSRVFRVPDQLEDNLPQLLRQIFPGIMVANQQIAVFSHFSPFPVGE
ncbi:MAG: hypothetical protein P9M08_01885, partial [Candidatus Erginobacter occultus]|nr:hypothetical protein [Candidatus Erginobacter occultus]